MTVKLLTLAISTIRQNFARALAIGNQVAAEFPERTEVLIVCQGVMADLEHPATVADNIRVVFSDERGLSKSRNLAIRHAASDYIWFLDDDVQLPREGVARVLELLAGRRPDVARVKVGSLEDKSRYYKRYRPLRRFRKVHLLQFSSIEVICRLGVLHAHSIAFDERFGLGTPYPCCEENLFLLRMFEVTEDIAQSEEACVFHSTLAAGRLELAYGHFFARGYVLSHYCAPIAVGVFARWIARATASRRLQAARAMWAGYLKGKSDALRGLSV